MGVLDHFSWSPLHPQEGPYTQLLIKPSSNSTPPKTALSTNLLASPKTAAKKAYRPTSKTSSPRVPRNTFLNTNITKYLCPSEHLFEHEYCPTFVSLEALFWTRILPKLCVKNLLLDTLIAVGILHPQDAMYNEEKEYMPVAHRKQPKAVREELHLWDVQTTPISVETPPQLQSKAVPQVWCGNPIGVSVVSILRS